MADPETNWIGLPKLAYVLPLLVETRNVTVPVVLIGVMVAGIVKD